MLLGNKSDLREDLTPSAENSLKTLFAKEPFKLYKVSAKTGANIK